MSQHKPSESKASRGDVAERTVPLGYIGNSAPGPPPQTIEIPKAFRPRQVSTSSEGSGDSSQPNDDEANN